jgi:hypothetical protein
MVATARTSGTWCATAKTAAPPSECPIRMDGAANCSRRWSAAHTRSSTFELKLVLAKSPPEAPSPVKSKRSTAIPKSVSAREIRAAARVSLLQVKQCANTA